MVAIGPTHDLVEEGAPCDQALSKGREKAGSVLEDPLHFLSCFLEEHSGLDLEA